MCSYFLSSCLRKPSHIARLRPQITQLIHYVLLICEMTNLLYYLREKRYTRKRIDHTTMRRKKLRARPLERGKGGKRIDVRQTQGSARTLIFAREEVMTSELNLRTWCERTLQFRRRFEHHVAQRFRKKKKNKNIESNLRRCVVTVHINIISSFVTWSVWWFLMKKNRVEEGEEENRASTAISIDIDGGSSKKPVASMFRLVANDNSSFFCSIYVAITIYKERERETEKVAKSLRLTELERNYYS